MENVFDELAVGTVDVKTEAATDGKKVALAEMKTALKKTLSSDPTFAAKAGSMADALEMVNTLGFGDSGNIIEVPGSKEAGERKVQQVSQIVGYRVKNNSATPIPYQTDVHTEGADGKFVAEKVERVLEPGQTVDLSRANLARLCSAPEFGFRLSNGYIRQGRKKLVSDYASIEEYLASNSFSFDRVKGGGGPGVNDDEIKLNVGEKVGNDWKVKKEFLEAFGFLNNPKESTKVTRKASGKSYTTQDLAANYIQQLLKEAEGK